MALIRDVVQKALKTGYLTIEAEEQLRVLLTTRYDLEDLNAFMTLQEAAMFGQVKQESRERLRYTVVECQRLRSSSKSSSSSNPQSSASSSWAVSA